MRNRLYKYSTSYLFSNSNLKHLKILMNLKLKNEISIGDLENHLLLSRKLRYSPILTFKKFWHQNF